MKISLKWIIIFLIAVLVAGCVSKENISETVKTSMQETLSTNTDFKDYNMTVIDVTVLKKNNGEYKGIASVEYEGTLHDISIDIIVDGENILWEAPFGSFSFIMQKEMQKLFQ